MEQASIVREAVWKKVRAEIIARDNFRCLECGISVRSAEADVHHLLPRSVGGSDEPSNLVTLGEMLRKLAVRYRE